jgi:hypothetical protein
LINLHDIETAVAERLKDGGYTVTAAEVMEGFDKPTFFIDIFQNSAAKENPFMELVNAGVELRYFPDIPTHEALVNMADSLTALFTKTSLKVQDRFLSVYEITFDTDATALLAYFELEFMRETAAEHREYEKIQDLQIGVKVHGTSSGSN